MKITDIDHIVLTTGKLDECLDFYTRLLGMELLHTNDRYALRFGSHKINIHTRPAEFLPAALNPVTGGLDLCFVTTEPIAAVLAELQNKNAPLETGIVQRNGAKGAMQSIYLRDPDGNLVEICAYE